MNTSDLCSGRRASSKAWSETARNFVGSYVKKDRLVTVQYPEERLPQQEAARNFPFLVYDGDDWQKGLRCVACQICEKECPPQCIYIVKDTVRKPDAAGKLQFQPKVFDIDISVCMSCQICVEVCPFDAIKMDVEYELSTGDRFGALAAAQRSSWRSPTSTTAKSIPPRRRSGRAARGRKGQGGSKGQSRCGGQTSVVRPSTPPEAGSGCSGSTPNPERACQVASHALHPQPADASPSPLQKGRGRG